MARKICVLDDDPAFLQGLSSALSGGYEVVAFEGVSAFQEAFAPRLFDLVVLDMRLESGREGLDVLREIQRSDPYQPVVVATAYADTETYLETLQAGALLYVDKSQHSPEALALLFDAVIQQGRLRREGAAANRMLERMDPMEIVGSSEPVAALRARIEQVARGSPEIVLIAGEPGSGRELAARNLHARRRRGIAPPLAVLPRQNVPPADIRRRLTGQRADTGNLGGLLEEAHGSGLVVRCADKLPATVLAFLVEMQQTGGFQPLGSKNLHPLDASLYMICEDAKSIRSAFWNRDIESVFVSPLRDRKEDIPLLASFFLENHRKRGREGAGNLDPTAMSSLLAHDWPGNVAELKNRTRVWRGPIGGGRSGDYWPRPPALSSRRFPLRK